MITDKNILTSKHAKHRWQLDKDLPHWVKGKDGVGDICKISNHSGYEDLRGSDLANAHIISAAPEAIEFIADLLEKFDKGLPFDAVVDVQRAEYILKKAFNF